MLAERASRAREIQMDLSVNGRHGVGKRAISQSASRLPHVIHVRMYQRGTRFTPVQVVNRAGPETVASPTELCARGFLKTNEKGGGHPRCFSLGAFPTMAAAAAVVSARIFAVAGHTRHEKGRGGKGRGR